MDLMKIEIKYMVNLLTKVKNEKDREIKKLNLMLTEKDIELIKANQVMKDLKEAIENLHK